MSFCQNAAGLAPKRSQISGSFGYNNRILDWPGFIQVASARGDRAMAISKRREEKGGINDP